MAIWQRCHGGTCKNPRRCLEHLWFNVMYRGRRFRMPANELAIPRMEPSKQRPIRSLEEARDWERIFIGEINGTVLPRFESGSYTGRYPETGTWAERREIWSLEGDGRLRVATTRRSSGDGSTAVTLLYRRP
jgi:hypothetical protein